MYIRSFGEVAAWIRGRRIDLKLTQADLAQMAGVSREWINALETGKSTVEFALVLRVLEVLGILVNLSTDIRSGTEQDSLDLNVFLTRFVS